MSKEKRIANTASLLIVLIILVLLMGGAYYYFFSELRHTVETISTLENDTNSLAAKETNLDSLKATFSETSGDRQKINSYFVQNDGAIDFVTTIENLAAFAHLTHETQSINTTDFSPPRPLQEVLHLTFKTTGSWQNTLYFLSMLETLPFNITINQINLHATGDTTNQTVAENVDLSATSSSSTVKTITKKASVWEATYDFSIVKLK